MSCLHSPFCGVFFEESMSPRGDFFLPRKKLRSFWIFFEKSCLESFQVRSIFVHLFFWGGGSEFDAEWLAMRKIVTFMKDMLHPVWTKNGCKTRLWRKTYVLKHLLKGENSWKVILFLLTFFIADSLLPPKRTRFRQIFKLAPVNPQKYSPKEAAKAPWRPKPPGFCERINLRTQRVRHLGKKIGFWCFFVVLGCFGVGVVWRLICLKCITYWTYCIHVYIYMLMYI